MATKKTKKPAKKPGKSAATRKAAKKPSKPAAKRKKPVRPAAKRPKPAKRRPAPAAKKKKIVKRGSSAKARSARPAKAKAKPKKALTKAQKKALVAKERAAAAKAKQVAAKKKAAEKAKAAKDKAAAAKKKVAEKKAKAARIKALKKKAAEAKALAKKRAKDKAALAKKKALALKAKKALAKKRAIEAKARKIAKKKKAAEAKARKIIAKKKAKERAERAKEKARIAKAKKLAALQKAKERAAAIEAKKQAAEEKIRLKLEAIEAKKQAIIDRKAAREEARRLAKEAKIEAKRLAKEAKINEALRLREERQRLREREAARVMQRDAPRLVTLALPVLPPPKKLSIEERAASIDARLTSQGDDFQRRYIDSFDMSWIYHDSALEGVVYTFEELRAALGAQPPPLTDSSLQPTYDDIKRHKEAIEFVRDFGQKKRLPVTLDVVKKIYLILHPEEGDVKTVKYRKDIPQHRLYFHEYAPPDKIAYKVRQVVDWLNDPETRKTRNGIRIAARTHYDLLRVYPFPSDSGKVARLFMNLLLMRSGLPPAIIHSTERQRYYEALKGSANTVLQMVQEAVENALASVEKLLDEHETKKRAFVS